MIYQLGQALLEVKKCIKSLKSPFMVQRTSCITYITPWASRSALESIVSLVTFLTLEELMGKDRD